MDQHTLNRLTCARQLADVLAEAGCETDDVFTLDTKAWRIAALAAGSRRGKPMSEPSDATKTLVYMQFLAREQAETCDTFAGLPR